MHEASNLLVNFLNLDPAAKEMEVLSRIIAHVASAMKIVRYQVGTRVHPVQGLAQPDARIQITYTNLLTPCLRVQGELTDAGTVYRMQGRRFMTGHTNEAMVNDQRIPGGLVLHLDNVDPDIETDPRAKITIAYIFHATPQTPSISLFAEVEIGHLSALAHRLVHT